MRYAIDKTDPTDVVVIVEDGGIATIHDNQDYMITTYYQERADKFTFDHDMWTTLSDGKAYLKDWIGEKELTETMIHDAICWLSPFAADWIEVDFDELTTQYNNQKIKP